VVEKVNINGGFVFSISPSPTHGADKNEPTVTLQYYADFLNFPVKKYDMLEPVLIYITT
jgi:hypothetical protein